MISKAQVWRVTKQVIREFWFPFVVAVIWTFFRVSRSDPDFVANLIANFSASFFLASWASGQIYRIIYRHDVEDSFQELGQQLNTIHETMEPMARLAKTVLESPSADPAVRALADATLAANAQVTAASTRFLQARQQLEGARPWYLDQADTPTPMRRPPNPDIYTNIGTIWPPPPDKPAEPTSR